MEEIKNKKEFDEALASNDKVIVKVGAPWCGPCKVVENNIKELEKRGTDVKFYEVNVDDADEDFVTGLGVRNVPVVFGYLNGSEIKRTVGVQTVDALSKFFD